MRNLFTFCIGLTSLICSSQSHFLPNTSFNSSSENVATIINATIPYQGYDEAQAYIGQGEFEIFPDVIDGILDKPILILDGFDPGDGRDIQGLYNSLSFNGENMADILREEGFDIVILNAPQYTTNGKFIDGGADYIQRNAMVLIALIEEINLQKQGNEELVILGPSMGGLISRYALAYMEQNNMDPDTRLFISFDAPHKGANIPISLQYIINYLAVEFGDAQSQTIIANVLNSPAAKEMLLDHLDAHLLEGSDVLQDPTLLEPLGAPDFRDNFQAELDGLGFPQNVRNVAMVNGSNNGTTTGTPGMQVVNTNLDLGNSINANIALHFTPQATQTNTVTDFATFLINIPLATFTADAASTAVTDGVDSAPGGTSEISDALGNGANNPVLIDFIEALDQDEFCFIPVISALAIENEENWFATPDIGGVHTSAFVNTYIPNVNESHVAVTQESAQFALDEIRNGSLGLPSNTLENTVFLRNPAKNKIQLFFNEMHLMDEITITIHNAVGQQIATSSHSIQQTQLEIPFTTPSGVYFINIAFESEIKSLKLIIE